MSKTKSAFRVGKVHVFLRGSVWYLTYHENGQRRRPRVGPNRDAAKQMAAQINAQLEIGAPAALSFEAITLAELRKRWLEHHEQVLCSSPQTVSRYRTATEHLLRFLQSGNAPRSTAGFRVVHAEATEATEDQMTNALSFLVVFVFPVGYFLSPPARRCRDCPKGQYFEPFCLND